MQLHSIDENIGQNAQTWSFKRREMLVDIYPLIPPQKRPRHIADGGLRMFLRHALLAVGSWIDLCTLSLHTTSFASLIEAAE